MAQALSFLLAIGGHFSSSMMMSAPGSMNGPCSPTSSRSMSAPPAAQGMNAPSGQFQLQNGSHGQDGRPRPEPSHTTTSRGLNFRIGNPPKANGTAWFATVVPQTAMSDPQITTRKCQTPWDYTHDVRILRATLPLPKWRGKLPIWLKDLDKGKVPEYPNGFGQNYQPAKGDGRAERGQ